MKLEEYISKYRGQLNNLQEVFLRNIYFPDFGEKGLELITPEYEIPKADGSGVYRIDFIIETPYRKYAIETDGLYYHAEGAVTLEYFNELQKKQNEIINLDFKLIRFTNDSVRNKPDECIWELRRNFIADKELYNIYMNRVSGIKPHEVQREVLAALKETRENGKKKALVVLATGLGKTYLSAFDVKEFNSKKTLFVVHINEILKQSIKSFQEVIPEKLNDMGFFIGSKKEEEKEFIFSSIQTLSRMKNITKFSKDEFDYIVIDETHHSAAPTYEKLFSYFTPKFFLGLTATPDRMDGKDILKNYDNNKVFEINQEDAIKKGYLVPFLYYGFKDDVDYSNIYFNGFRYDVDDLNKVLLIENRDLATIKKFKEMGGDRKTIAFCTSIEHADWSAAQFNKHGIKSIAIHSKSDDLDVEIDLKAQESATQGFRDGKYQIAFVVNMFNEGIDIPDVSCLLFLRPTESKTIFIQHMGRGLRISPGKENVLVLDFIGNYRTANTILSGLGIKDTQGLNKKTIQTKDGEKIIYYYDNNGCSVSFDQEVVDIFKRLETENRTETRPDLITEEWKEFGDYLEKCTTQNLYWKRGQQNQYFEVQLEALRVISNKLDITETDFVIEIQKIIDTKYPGKNMTAGFRALFISKITGLFFERAPTEVFYAINQKTEDFNNFESYKDILTNQLEKIYYWNSIYGSYNKYLPEDQRADFKEFKIYPFFFIYELLVKLNDDYGFDPQISKFEFDTFVSTARKHSEIEDVIKNILLFREYEEKHELTRYLREKNKIDQRFYSLLKYNKYLQCDDNSLKIDEPQIEDLRKHLLEFHKIYETNSLIEYKYQDDKEDEENQEYFKMLLSPLDIIDYHKGK